MTSFDQGDVVLVQFPYTDRDARYRRPTLVISRRAVASNWPLVWVLMITSAENRSWPGDVSFGDRYREAGLLDPSVVRTAKVATVDREGGTRIGRIPSDLMDRVTIELQAILGFHSDRGAG